MTTWINTTSTATTTNFPVIYSDASYVVTPGTVYWPPAPAPAPPKPRTALEWLDAEIEKTCALARGVR